MCRSLTAIISSTTAVMFSGVRLCVRVLTSLDITEYTENIVIDEEMWRAAGMSRFRWHFSALRHLILSFFASGASVPTDEVRITKPRDQRRDEKPHINRRCSRLSEKRRRATKGLGCSGEDTGGSVISLMWPNLIPLSPPAVL